MTAAEFLYAKGVFNPETKKTEKDIIRWMEEYAAIKVKEQPCSHPYSSVQGDGEMSPAKCLACGENLSH